MRRRGVDDTGRAAGRLKLAGEVADRRLPVPAARLSLFYFVLFATVGGLLPYLSLYLDASGFEPRAIGATVALMMATRIVAPNFWGWIADRRGRRLGVVRFGSAAALVVFAALPWAEGFVATASVIVLFSVFWTAVLPQFEAVTLSHLAERVASYSRIRLWGSVGFIAASSGVGLALDRSGAGALPWLVMMLLALVVVAGAWVPEPPRAAQRSDAGPALVSVLATRPAAWLLLACLLMQASHGPYYVFFSIHLEELGYPRAQIGALWSLGVVAEVGLFVIMPALLVRFALGPLFVLCFVLTTLRWLMLGLLPATVAVLVAVQCLHAVSFGAYHAVAIQLVHRLFPGRLQGRGQALYSSLSFGAGGALGSLAAGWSWHAAGAAPTWLAAAGVAVLGALSAAAASRTRGH